MSAESAPVGVMLVNFGVPDSPEPREVGKFMNSYYADRRMLGGFSLFVSGLLHYRRRKKYLGESVARFKDLYDGDHFPYMKISARLRRKVWLDLYDMGATNVEVLLAFRYGEPSMKEGFKRLDDLGCKRILVLPLYPQSSFEFTATIHDEYIREQRGFKSGMDYRFVDNFYKDPKYISAVAESIRGNVDLGGDGSRGDKLVFAYRTIPAKDAMHGDTYELQTAATSQAIANELGLDRRQWTISYIPYNHLNISDVLVPGIDETVERFGIGGVRNVAVVCPGQVVDSVDTLYEIDERMRQRFESQFVGDSEGCSFTYVPALNDCDAFADALATLIYDSIDGWEDSYAAGILHPRSIKEMKPDLEKLAGGKAAAMSPEGQAVAASVVDDAVLRVPEEARPGKGDAARIKAAVMTGNVPDSMKAAFPEGKKLALEDLTEEDINKILDAIYGEPKPKKGADADVGGGFAAGDPTVIAGEDGVATEPGAVSAPAGAEDGAAAPDACSEDAAPTSDAGDAGSDVDDALESAQQKALRNLPDLEGAQGSGDSHGADRR